MVFEYKRLQDCVSLCRARVVLPLMFGPQLAATTLFTLECIWHLATVTSNIDPLCCACLIGCSPGCTTTMFLFSTMIHAWVVMTASTGMPRQDITSATTWAFLWLPDLGVCTCMRLPKPQRRASLTLTIPAHGSGTGTLHKMQLLQAGSIPTIPCLSCSFKPTARKLSSPGAKVSGKSGRCLPHDEVH